MCAFMNSEDGLPISFKIGTCLVLIGFNDEILGCRLSVVLANMKNIFVKLVMTKYLSQMFIKRKYLYYNILFYL